MERSFKSLTHYGLGAIDGEIGKICDVYVDGATWHICYWIVDTGTLLDQRKVMIAAHSVLGIECRNKTFETSLSRNQIKDSPVIDTNKAESNQQEIISDHFRNYWFLPIKHGVLLDKEANRGISNINLRSLEVLLSCKIYGTDSYLGRVIDYILDTKYWKIDYLIIEIGGLFRSQKVLIPIKLINTINWTVLVININMAKKEFGQLQCYDPQGRVNILSDGSFLDYHGRPAS
ncbi:PRC-barrel domain-containing protein [Dyadobacter sandarakinus]|uniref:PRC-barrel domain-containing protein n=1 Tax=Dyadobacter sandarakinus TaxID=2747268 RepID=A0ABX7I4H0_9BACT|nr:PRC-barrel domain-containing protein [Dyadobacter sandarakinus]QRR00830.1 PRC-barrel domain-containing protein [Dyadobacter sandarakinus]